VVSLAIQTQFLSPLLFTCLPRQAKFFLFCSFFACMPFFIAQHKIIEIYLSPIKIAAASASKARKTPVVRVATDVNSYQGGLPQSGKTAPNDASWPQPMASTSKTVIPEPVDTDDSDEETTGEYLSFDSESDEDEPRSAVSEVDRKAEREAGEKERQRVLEAANLVIQVPSPAEQTPSGSLSRRPTRLKRGVSVRIPSNGNKKAPQPELAVERELPPVHSPVESVLRVDDAFDRYEAFKMHRGNHRLSTISTDSSMSAVTAPSIVGSVPMGREPSSDSRSHTAASGLLHFFGRINAVTGAAPAPERRPSPNISSPIISSPINNGSTTISRENSPAFGTVSCASVWRGCSLADVERCSHGLV
jgi:hypothetical protein